MADGESNIHLLGGLTPEGRRYAIRTAYAHAQANAALIRHIEAGLREVDPLVPHAAVGRRLLVRNSLAYLARVDGIDPAERFAQMCIDMIRLDGSDA